MRRTITLFALVIPLIIPTLSCPRNTRGVEVSEEDFAKAVRYAREKASVYDSESQPREYVREFEAAIRPTLEKAAGEEIPPFPIDWRAEATPMYVNMARMAEATFGLDTYRGSKKEGALRVETVSLPLPNGEPCTAVVIALNAIATAEHCADKFPTEFWIGPFYAQGQKVSFLREEVEQRITFRGPQGQLLDMAVIVRKNDFDEIKEPDLQVFASADLIDSSDQLRIVGYGGADAYSNGAGTKRVGRVPMNDSACDDVNAAEQFECVSGLEIVAARAPMGDRVACPASDAPNPVQGACRGDSGGPVYVERNNRLFLAGVIRTYRESGCRCAQATNLYVRLDRQLDRLRCRKNIHFGSSAFSHVGPAPNCEALGFS